MKIGDEEPQLSCSDERTVGRETGRRKMSLLHHLYCVCVQREGSVKHFHSTTQYFVLILHAQK